MVTATFAADPSGSAFRIACSCGQLVVVRVGSYFQVAELRAWATFVAQAADTNCAACKHASSRWQDGQWPRSSYPSRTMRRIREVLDALRNRNRLPAR